MKLEELVNRNYQQLNDNDLYIWNYIIHHRKECERLSIDELALRCSVSRSTILRFSKRLGLKGYAEFKVFLRIDNQKNDKNALTDNIFNHYIETLEQYRDYHYKEIVQSIYEAKNLYVYGTGVIQDNTAQHLKRSFSMVNKLFLDIDVLADFEAYINLFGSNDVFIAISYAGENQRLLDYVYRLKAKGVIVVAIIANNDCTLSHVADYSLHVKTLPVMTNQGRREDLVGNYFILIDFIIANYIEYAKSRGNENDLYIWQYILHHKRECQRISIKDLARNCNVSHTSILRFTKKLGLEGFSELKVHLKWDLAQKPNFKPRIIDDTYHEFIETMERMKNRDLTNIMEMIEKAERVFVYGTGVVQANMAGELRRVFLYTNKVFHAVGNGTEIDTILNNVTKNDLFIIISLSGDNETAVTLARALRGLHIPRIGIAKVGNTLLSKYCDDMITFRYETFKVGMSDILYGSTAHFFIISDFLFLRYLEYSQEKG